MIGEVGVESGMGRPGGGAMPGGGGGGDAVVVLDVVVVVNAGAVAALFRVETFGDETDDRDDPPVISTVRGLFFGDVLALPADVDASLRPRAMA